MIYQNIKLNTPPQTSALLKVKDIADLIQHTSIDFYQSASELPEYWDNLVPENQIFLRNTYLQTLQESCPEGMRFCYLTFSLDKQLIGVAACQIKYFKGDETLTEQAIEEKDPCYFKTVARYFKSFVARKVEFYTLVCGSLLLTGEHGYFFDKRIPQESAIQLLMKGLEQAKKALNKKGIPISLTLLKDFFEEARTEISTLLVEDKFLEFTVQPNMILDFPPEWSSFEDYLAAMSSKYRVRVKRAAKKGKNIIRKEMNLEEIQENEARLYELYKGVSKNAGFNTYVLHPEYFTSLKLNLKEKFKLIGCYHEDKLVGFYTTILNGDELEAHFLGFEYTMNRTAQIYLNMLYDMVKIGLESGVNRIVFARTALEIKSSIGAVPKEMYCYMRHSNNFPNKFLKNFFDYLNPVEEWTQRHPFKTNSNS